MIDRRMRSRGAWATVVLVTGHAVLSAALWWGTAGAVATVRAPGAAPVGALVAVVAAGAAWVLLTWLAAVTLLTVVMTAAAGVGARAQVRVAAATPAVARRLATALLGVSVLGAPLAAAAPAGARPVVAVVTRDHAQPSVTPTRAGVPDLDRPAARVPARSVAPLPAGWTPDRPVATARRSTTAEASVRLVTGALHAERAAPDGVVVVRRGDTLWGIAARHLGPEASAAEVAEEWPRWYAANRAVIGDDPDLLAPGDRLRPP